MLNDVNIYYVNIYIYVTVIGMLIYMLIYMLTYMLIDCTCVSYFHPVLVVLLGVRLHRDLLLSSWLECVRPFPRRKGWRSPRSNPSRQGFASLGLKLDGIAQGAPFGA